MTQEGLGFPDINTLEPLADALGISLVELMQSKRNKKNESISEEKVVELLQNTIQLSKTPNRLTKILGIIILSVFAIIAVIDTIDSVVMIACAFSVITLLLNVIMIVISKRHKYLCDL